MFKQWLLCFCISLRGNWISYINPISGAFDVDREGYYFSFEQSTQFIAQHGVMKLKITECSCAISSLTCLSSFGNSAAMWDTFSPHSYYRNCDRKHKENSTENKGRIPRSPNTLFETLDIVLPINILIICLWNGKKL